MGCGARGETLHAVTAFKHGDDTPAAGGVGDLHQFRRDPVEIAVLKLQRSQRVKVMGIEAGGNDDELRVKRTQGRQYLIPAALPELR